MCGKCTYILYFLRAFLHLTYQRLLMNKIDIWDSPHRVAEHWWISLKVLHTYINTLTPFHPTSYQQSRLKNIEQNAIINIQMELLKVFFIFALVAATSCYSVNYGEFEPYEEDAFSAPHYVSVITYLNWLIYIYLHTFNTYNLYLYRFLKFIGNHWKWCRISTS